MLTLGNSELFNSLCAALAGRPTDGLELTTTDSTATVAVDSTALTLSQSGESDQTVAFVGYSLHDVATAINALPLDIHARALLDTGVLSEHAFITISSPKNILSEFDLQDTTKDGCILRLRGWTIQPRDLAHFSMELPYDDGPLLPWYPRIRTGSLTVKRGNRTYRFSVPEYSSQSWSLKYGAPYRDIEGAIPTAFKDDVLKVSRTPLYWDGSNIQIFSDGQPLGDVVQDVDIHNGLIYLKPGTALSQVSINYTYIEETYVYKGINLNPHIEQQPNILDKVVLIYLTPAGYSIEEGSVHHLVATSVQGALDSIPYEDETMPVLVLGAIVVQQQDYKSRVQVSDARVLGGGLFGSRKGAAKDYWQALKDRAVEEQAKVLENLYKESAFLADIGHWDGYPAPAAGCVLVQLPDYLQDKEADVQQALYNNLAVGIQPILEFYSATGLASMDGGEK